MATVKTMKVAKMPMAKGMKPMPKKMKTPKKGKC